MKKIWTTAILSMLMLSMTAVVSVSADTQSIEPYDEEPIVDIDNSGELDYEDPSLDIQDIEEPLESGNSRLEKLKNSYKSNSEKSPKIKFRGIWGYLGENETEGYVGGFLGRRGRVGFLKGVWNTTDGSTKGRVAGILKRGFFNGKIVTEDGIHRITGLYKINREKQVFHLRWMTVNKVGWAHCRIKLD